MSAITFTILKFIRTTTVILITTIITSITFFFTFMIILPLGYKFLSPWVRSRIGVAHPRYLGGGKSRNRGGCKRGERREIQSDMRGKNDYGEGEKEGIGQGRFGSEKANTDA
jgi:hypothetical protein